MQQLTVSNSRPIASEKYIGTGVDVEKVSMGIAIPFKRVATSSASVVSLSAIADAQENLTIEWTDSDGNKRQTYYPASYAGRSPAKNP